MWFFGSMMALYMIYLMIKWGLIIGAVIIGLWLVVAIIRGISNGWNGYSNNNSTNIHTKYQPEKKDSYNIDIDYAIPPGSGLKDASGGNYYYQTPKPIHETYSEGTYIIVGVRFQSGGKIYEYIADNPHVYLGSTVYVDTPGGVKALKVETLKRCSESNLELPLKKYKKAYSSADKLNQNKSFSITGTITVEGSDDYTDDLDLNADENKEKSLLEIEEEETLSEPYVCPECGDAYDGIYCEACGHLNEEPGYEEVSEDDQWFENMAMMAFFDAEDKKMEAEREERESFLFGDYSDEFGEDDEW